MNEHYKHLPLNPLRAFAIASQHRTFTAAAEYMGISQVAISRQIAILENYLGMKLFERGARSVKLTEMGRSFGYEILPLFDSLEHATGRILSDQREHTISLRTYPTFAHHWLLPRLAKFRDIHPELEVKLDTTVEPLDFRGTHLDMAIQLGHGDWRDSKWRVLFEEEVDAVCSADYAKKLNNFKKLEDLKDAVLLHSKYRRRAWQDWANSVDIELDHRSGLEYQSSMLTYSATWNGFGVAIGQTQVLMDELKKGTLVQPFARPHKTGASFYIVWPTTRSVSTKTKRLIDWLLTEAGQPAEFYKDAGFSKSEID